jgi:ATP-dependent Clp protease ATP-binding subunit ClpA
MAEYKMTPRLRDIMDNASEMLEECNNQTVGVEHVMLAMLDDPRAIPTQVLGQFVEPVRVREALRDFLDSEGYKAGNGGSRSLSNGAAE